MMVWNKIEYMLGMQVRSVSSGSSVIYMRLDYPELLYQQSGRFLLMHSFCSSVQRLTSLCFEIGGLKNGRYWSNLILHPGGRILVQKSCWPRDHSISITDWTIKHLNWGSNLSRHISYTFSQNSVVETVLTRGLADY